VRGRTLTRAIMLEIFLDAAFYCLICLFHFIGYVTVHDFYLFYPASKKFAFNEIMVATWSHAMCYNFHTFYL